MNRWQLMGWSLLAVQFLSSPGWAASSANVTLPSPSGAAKKQPSGLQLDIDSHWVDSAGYRPIIVTVSSLAPAVADRHLTISLVPQDWSPQRNGVEFQLTLPQGATSASKEVAVPQLDIWRRMSIATVENGRELEDLTEDTTLIRSIANLTWTEAYPSMLFIDADAPHPDQVSAMLAGSSAKDRHLLPDILAVRHLFAPLDDYVQNLWRSGLKGSSGSGDERVRSDDNEILTAMQKLQMVALLPAAELPRQWLNYTSLDLVFISLTDARDMSRARPESWGAILEYVRAGGNLIVHGVGADFDTLPELDQLLGVASELEASHGDGTSESRADRWQPLREAAFGFDLLWLGSPAHIVRDHASQMIPIDELEADREDLVDLDEDGDIDDDDAALVRKPSARQDLFRVRPLGWGQVLALGPDELGDADEYHWAWALNDIGPDRWRWYRRNGLSRQRSNPTFWNFLIPGVGAAPVRTFLAVITAFMIIIGPVNYFVLSRSRRLYLLLITVPLGSALIIGSLFAFAVLKDGLGTRTRLRSFSQLMPDGRATSWSRQSYYAGLAPSSGLNYPRDAAVFPVEFDRGRNTFARRMIRWSDVQQFASGYLSARSTFQNLVIHSDHGEPLVKLERTGTDLPRATNLSSIPIDHLLIRDHDETFWLSDLLPGATADAEPLTLTEAQGRYAAQLRAHHPETPPGFTAPLESRVMYFRNFDFDSALGPPDFQSSLLEVAIGRPTTQNESMGRVFYAVTEQSPPYVPIGVKEGLDVSGFHVIHGAW